MKKVSLSIFLLVFTLICFGQQDSIVMSVFVSPVEEVFVDDQDEGSFFDSPIEVEDLEQEYEYTFYAAGVDTILVNSFDIEFTTPSGEVFMNSFTKEQIEVSESLERIGDVYLLPFMVNNELFHSFEYSVTLKDEDGNVVLSQSDIESEIESEEN